MEWEWPIHPGLAGLVARMVGYDFTLDPAAVHYAVPGPVATLVVSLDEPLDIGWLDAESTRARVSVLAAGLHLRPALIRTHGVQRGIQLSLTPLGCRRLLGAPLGQLAHALVDHRDLPRALPVTVPDRIAATPDWPGRLALLEGELLRLAGTAPAGPSAGVSADLPGDLAVGWRLLARTRGGIPTAALAQRLGWSRRHLVTRFRSEFGMPPSEVARLHRLGAAVEHARTGARWADVAAVAGFADQAHLTREFGVLTGRTPTRWRAEAFPVVQDIDLVDAGG